MVKNILCKAVCSDEAYKVNVGTWLEADAANLIVDFDADVWGQEKDGTIRLLAKFRKNCLEPTVVKVGWDSFRTAGTMTRGRAAAAGPIDLSGAYWQKRKPDYVEGYSAQYWRPDGTLSKMRVQNPVASGTVGFFEKTSFLKVPCRLTSYTRKNFKRFLGGVPFIKAIDNQFKRLIPVNHELQRAAASATPDYQIADTAFSTVTVNMNFRTAVHKDAGDFEDGFGNLTVIEYGKYRGGFTIFPRFRIGFDVRSGDFLAMNVHEYHGNSPIWTTPEDDEYNLTLPDIRVGHPETGVAGSSARYGRLTFVCYLRKKIALCDKAATEKYYKEIGFKNERVVLSESGTGTSEHTQSMQSDSPKVHKAVS